MELGALGSEAARQLAITCAPGGCLPEEVLAYIVQHCEGICLNVQQMARTPPHLVPVLELF